MTLRDGDEAVALERELAAGALPVDREVRVASDLLAALAAPWTQRTRACGRS